MLHEALLLSDFCLIPFQLNAMFSATRATFVYKDAIQGTGNVIHTLRSHINFRRSKLLRDLETKASMESSKQGMSNG